MLSLADAKQWFVNTSAKIVQKVASAVGGFNFDFPAFNEMPRGLDEFKLIDAKFNTVHAMLDEKEVRTFVNVPHTMPMRSNLIDLKSVSRAITGEVKSSISKIIKPAPSRAAPRVNIPISKIGQEDIKTFTSVVKTVPRRSNLDILSRAVSQDVKSVVSTVNKVRKIAPQRPAPQRPRERKLEVKERNDENREVKVRSAEDWEAYAKLQEKQNEDLKRELKTQKNIIERLEDKMGREEQRRYLPYKVNVFNKAILFNTVEEGSTFHYSIVPDAARFNKYQAYMHRNGKDVNFNVMFVRNEEPGWFKIMLLEMLYEKIEEEQRPDLRASNRVVIRGHVIDTTRGSRRSIDGVQCPIRRSTGNAGDSDEKIFVDNVLKQINNVVKSVEQIDLTTLVFEFTNRPFYEIDPRTVEYVGCWSPLCIIKRQFGGIKTEEDIKVKTKGQSHKALMILRTGDNMCFYYCLSVLCSRLPEYWYDDHPEIKNPALGALASGAINPVKSAFLDAQGYLNSGKVWYENKKRNKGNGDLNGPLLLNHLNYILNTLQVPQEERDEVWVNGSSYEHIAKTEQRLNDIMKLSVRIMIVKDSEKVLMYGVKGKIPAYTIAVRDTGVKEYYLTPPNQLDARRNTIYLLQVDYIDEKGANKAHFHPILSVKALFGGTVCDKCTLCFGRHISANEQLNHEESQCRIKAQVERPAFKDGVYEKDRIYVKPQPAGGTFEGLFRNIVRRAYKEAKKAAEEKKKEEESDSEDDSNEEFEYPKETDTSLMGGGVPLIPPLTMTYDTVGSYFSSECKTLVTYDAECTNTKAKEYNSKQSYDAYHDPDIYTATLRKIYPSKAQYAILEYASQVYRSMKNAQIEAGNLIMRSWNLQTLLAQKVISPERVEEAKEELARIKKELKELNAPKYKDIRNETINILEKLCGMQHESWLERGRIFYSDGTSSLSPDDECMRDKFIFVKSTQAAVQVTGVSLDTTAMLWNWLRQHNKAFVIAHYGGKYDHHLLYSFLARGGINPRNITMDSSIYKIKYRQGNLTFIDSFKFMSEALRKLPKMFGLKSYKGFAPFGFTCDKENMIPLYNGESITRPSLGPKGYDVLGKKPDEAAEMTMWYHGIKGSLTNEDPFNILRNDFKLWYSNTPKEVQAEVDKILVKWQDNLHIALVNWAKTAIPLETKAHDEIAKPFKATSPIKWYQYVIERIDKSRGDKRKSRTLEAEQKESCLQVFSDYYKVLIPVIDHMLGEFLPASTERDGIKEIPLTYLEIVKYCCDDTKVTDEAFYSFHNVVRTLCNNMDLTTVCTAAGLTMADFLSSRYHRERDIEFGRKKYDTNIPKLRLEQGIFSRPCDVERFAWSEHLINDLKKDLSDNNLGIKLLERMKENLYDQTRKRMEKKQDLNKFKIDGCLRKKRQELEKAGHSPSVVERNMIEHEQYLRFRSKEQLDNMVELDIMNKLHTNCMPLKGEKFYPVSPLNFFMYLERTRNIKLSPWSEFKIVHDVVYSKRGKDYRFEAAIVPSKFSDDYIGLVKELMQGMDPEHRKQFEGAKDPLRTGFDKFKAGETMRPEDFVYVLDYLSCREKGCEKCQPKNKHTDEAKANAKLRKSTLDYYMKSCYTSTLDTCEKDMEAALSEEDKKGMERSRAIFIDPATAMFGGRVEIFRNLFKPKLQSLPDPISGVTKELFSEQAQMQEIDVVSLYPTVMAMDDYPVGFGRTWAPLNDTERDELLQRIKNKDFIGLVKCKFSHPGKDLHIPVLPHKLNGKLVYSLEDGEGTYASPYIRNAILTNYKIDIISVREYARQSNLFIDHVEKYGKIKTIYSEKFKTQEDCDKVIEEAKLGGLNIHFTPEETSNNPGMRALAKLMLNSLFGKFVQTLEARWEYAFSNSASEYKSLLYMAQEGQVILPDDLQIAITGKGYFRARFKKVDSEIFVPHFSSTITGLFTTASAQSRTYQMLSSLDPSQPHYTDTDSVYYNTDPSNKNHRTVSHDGICDLEGKVLPHATEEEKLAITPVFESMNNLKLGKALGRWEMGKDRIIHAAFDSLKSYAKETNNAEESIKMKGIPASLENIRRFGLDKKEEMVRNPEKRYESGGKMSFISDIRNVDRDETGIRTRMMTRQIGAGNDKRQIIQETFSTAPHGVQLQVQEH